MLFKNKATVIGLIVTGMLLMWAAPRLLEARPATVTPMVYLPVVMRQSTPTPTVTRTPTVTPTPTITPTPIQTATPFDDGYLHNGDFEIPDNTTGSGHANWSPWWAEIPKPNDGSYNYAYRPNSINHECKSSGAASAFIYLNDCSQRVLNNYDPWWAGVYQLVSAPAGQRVRLTAYGRAWAANSGYPAPSETDIDMKMRVGIAPNGDCNAFAGGIVWSASYAPHDVWQTITVDATVGGAGQVCVFLSADYRGYIRAFMSTFWDAVSLRPAP